MVPGILNIATNWWVSCYGYFTIDRTAPGVQWIGEYFSPTASLEDVDKSKASCACWKSNHDSTIVQLIV